MDLKKQGIILAVVVVLVGIIQLGYQKFFNHQNTADRAAVYLIKNHLNLDILPDLVTSSDAVVIKELGSKYIDLTKLPSQTITEASVAADVVLSEKAHKVDLQTNSGIVSLSMVEQNGKWVAFLNLKEKLLVTQLLESLKDAELRENEYDMLAIYRKLQEVVPSDVYQEKIQMLTKFIEDKKEKEEYVKNIYVSDLKLTGKILTGLIKNQGNRKVKTIKASLQIINPEDGAVSSETPVTIYEVIPGSFVFGQPINPNHQKKFGLNLETLPSISKLETLYISITSVEFFE